MYNYENIENISKLEHSIATKLITVIAQLHQLGNESRESLNKVALYEPAKLLAHPSLKMTASTYQLIEAAEAFVKTLVGDSAVPKRALLEAAPVATEDAKGESKKESKGEPSSKRKKDKKDKKDKPYIRKGNWGGTRPNSGRRKNKDQDKAPADNATNASQSIINDWSTASAITNKGK